MNIELAKEKLHEQDDYVYELYMLYGVLEYITDALAPEKSTENPEVCFYSLIQKRLGELMEKIEHSNYEIRKALEGVETLNTMMTNS
ncbi:MAG: hypothetical protein LBU61_02405 [Coriobacteriales bacterium]|jgi:hypothetical protein|nr:hypothetical protein [Coriobacteriales bacterium]